MQVLDADRDQQQGRRCATEPTDRRPAPRTTALRRDGERPPGRLHRQAADCLSRLTKTVEAAATFRATGDMVLNARPTFSTQLVVDEGGELFERRPVVLARFTRHGRPPGGKLPDAAAAAPAPVRAPGRSATSRFRAEPAARRQSRRRPCRWHRGEQSPPAYRARAPRCFHEPAGGARWLRRAPAGPAW